MSIEKKFHKIAVLSGGLSSERAVSIVSAQGCFDALIEKGYAPYLIDPQDKDWVQQLIVLQPDAVLNMLHGRYGEDGQVQGVLESLHFPYSHSGVCSSAIAMDKTATKKILEHHGLPVAPSVEVSRYDFFEKAQSISFPCILKPVREGSSVDICILENKDQVPENLLENKKKSRRYMLEKFIPGREMTVSVVNGEALAVTEIMLPKALYDYEAKYTNGIAAHQVPANLPKDIYNKMMDYAVQAHDILGCKGVSRTDFRYDETDSDGIVILEINTQPGMTPTSLVPEQAEHKGISYPDLVQIMVEDASCNR